MNSDHSQEVIEAAPSSPSFSISEKLALYGSAGLSGMELLVLLVGKESIAKALVRHFGSLKVLSRVSLEELRIPNTAPVRSDHGGLSVAMAEHAMSAPLNNAEAIYKANLDMKGSSGGCARRSFRFPAALHHQSRHLQGGRGREGCHL